MVIFFPKKRVDFSWAYKRVRYLGGMVFLYKLQSEECRVCKIFLIFMQVVLVFICGYFREVVERLKGAQVSSF